MHYTLKRSGERILGLENVPDDLEPYDIGGTKGIRDLVPEFDLLSAKHKHHLNAMFNYRYFHDICDALHGAGYVDHVTSFGVPYDFRLVLDPTYREKMFDGLGNILSSSVKQTGEKAVVVSHSLGGLLLKWFLTSRPYYQDMLDMWVSVSTPFAGSHYALRVALCGDHYIPFFKSYVRDEVARNTGIAMCFPNSLGFDVNEPLAKIGQRNVTIGEYAAFDTVPFQLYCDLFQPYLNLIEQPIQVPIHAVLATNKPTGGYFEMSSISEQPSTIEMVQGDGLVSERSLMVYEKVIHHRCMRELLIATRDHTSLLLDADVIKLICSYALGKR
jgi:hypothetical protein